MIDAAGQRIEREVTIAAGRVSLAGTLTVPAGSSQLVLFAHGSGSSRRSTRNVFVAKTLEQAGVGTLLFDLLTNEEEAADRYTSQHRFDIPLLAERLIHATEWVEREGALHDATIGYFGASTGSAAALIAAARLGDRIRAVVSRGGRLDLAMPVLQTVSAPTLLVVGSNDPDVLELNQQAFDRLRCEKRIAIVPGGTHLFEEPGTLEEVARLASQWFRQHLLPGARA